MMPIWIAKLSSIEKKNAVIRKKVFFVFKINLKYLKLLLFDKYHNNNTMSRDLR